MNFNDIETSPVAYKFPLLDVQSIHTNIKEYEYLSNK